MHPRASPLPGPGRPGPPLCAAAGAALSLVLTVVLLLGTLAAGAGAQAAPAGPDPLADADHTVEQLRREADAASGRYFDALARTQTTALEIADLEARLPQLERDARRLRRAVRARAVAAYETAGRGIATLLSSDDVLAAARRAQWLGRLDDHDRRLTDELVASADQLAARRDELRTARETEAAALEQVRRDGAAIDTKLTAAVTRRASLQAAAVAATSTTAPTTTVGRQASAPRPTLPPSAPPTAPPSYVPTAGVHPHHDDPFLVCTRARESGGRYNAFNPAGPYLGAYQFLQATWNSAANHAGRPGLIGVPPNTASPYDQDDVAWSLYQWRGSGPWGGGCSDAVSIAG